MTEQQPNLIQQRRATFPTIFGLAALVFVLDQATKYLVLATIPHGQTWDYLPWISRLFQITFVKNTGAAFGTFPQMGNILLGIAVLVVVAITFFYHHLPVELFLVQLSVGLQLGGALGNLIDRIVHGFVVDLIDISFWPIFNLADAAIVSGVLILTYVLWEEEDNLEVVSSTMASPQSNDKTTSLAQSQTTRSHAQ